MRREERMRMEALLRGHYREGDAAVRADAGEVRARASRVAALAVAEAARTAPLPSVRAFLAAQVSFMRARLGAVFACWAACVVLCALRGADGSAALLGMTFAGSVLALVCLPEAVGSRAHGMVELEGSCAFNAHAVACARLAVMGCASVAALLVGAALCAGTRPVWAAVAHALVPYFVSCAGGLLVARRAASADAMAFVLAWAGMVCALCGLAFVTAPALYAAASDGVWLLSALASALWCAREVARSLEQAAAPFEQVVSSSAVRALE